jgi:hypothetical protein
LYGRTPSPLFKEVAREQCTSAKNKKHEAKRQIHLRVNLMNHADINAHRKGGYNAPPDKPAGKQAI